MHEDFRLLWRLLSPTARRSLLVVLFLLVCSSALELAAVLLITRFMGAIVGVRELSGSLSLLPGWSLPAWQAALVTVGAFATSNFLLGLSNWRLGRYVWEQEVDISCRVLEAVLRMPYRQFLGRNSGTLHQQIWCESLCRGLLAGALFFCYRGLSCLFLLLGVIYADWRSAAFSSVAVLLIYTLIHKLLTGPLAALGEQHWAAQGERQRLTVETLGAYKSVKLMQRWPGLLELYRKSARLTASRSGIHQIVTELPRYVLETTALAGLVGMAIYLLYRQDTRIFTMISLYGIAGYRLLPGVHSLFQLASQMRFHRKSVEDTWELLRTGRPVPEQASPPLHRELAVENARIQFPGRTQPALDGLSLKVERGHMVGLAGATGSGKSTLLDVLSGLLALDEGRVMIDGQELVPAGVTDWQRRLGFLPQAVETLDDTLAANICFGLARDEQRLERVVCEAELEGFVRELPAGLETRVGERASFLSSGQRQRLGLARALYHQPAVLLLDEATSSLDPKTEEALLATLCSYRGERTMVMAAHRATALAVCDWIYVLDAGRVVAQGSYAELLAECPQFQRLMALGESGEPEL